MRLLMGILDLKPKLISTLQEAQKNLKPLQNSKTESVAFHSNEIALFFGVLEKAYGTISITNRKECGRIIQNHIQSKIQPPFTTEKRDAYAKKLLSITVVDEETANLARIVLEVVNLHAAAQDAIKGIPAVGKKAARKLQIVVAAKEELEKGLNQYEAKISPSKKVKPAVTLKPKLPQLETKVSDTGNAIFAAKFAELDKFKAAYHELMKAAEPLGKLKEYQKEKTKQRRSNSKKNPLTEIKEKKEKLLQFRQNIQSQYLPLQQNIETSLQQLGQQVLVLQNDIQQLNQKIKDEATEAKKSEICNDWSTINKSKITLEQNFNEAAKNFAALIQHASYFKINFPELYVLHDKIDKQLKALLEQKATLDKNMTPFQSQLRTGFVTKYSHQFAEYLKQRASQYKFRDFFSRIFAFFFGWLGYKTEKAKRLHYIENDLKPRLKLYEENGTAESQQAVESVFKTGLTIFKPRSNAGASYQKSLKNLLSTAQAEFIENSRISLHR